MSASAALRHQPRKTDDQMGTSALFKLWAASAKAPALPPQRPLRRNDRYGEIRTPAEDVARTAVGQTASSGVMRP